MARLALYRSWRPQRFEEVVGQEQVVKALKNAVRLEQVSHAYLFCGPRGTGKTSVAKILAKAVNCSEPVDGEPCNTCLPCEEITIGSFMDVIEIDAASNRGIDEIRDLREKVRMLPVQGKTKVYIIDEVHMLTQEAFNALLKTLEEPPSRVIFILATTEPHKIPPTILSRCQRYNFRRLTRKEIADRLKLAAVDSGVPVQEEALELIARRAGGSLRDGLSILDQCLAYGKEGIAREDVLDILGIVDDSFLCRLFDCVLDGDTGKVLGCIKEALDEGKDARQLSREASEYLRDLLVIKTVDQYAQLSLVSEGMRKELIRQAGQTEASALLVALKKLMELTGELRYNESQRFLLEITFLDLITVLGPGREDASPGGEPVGAVAATGNKVGPEPAAASGAEQIPWPLVLEKVKARRVTTHALLAEARCLGMKDNLVLIGFKKGFKFHREKMAEKGNRAILLQAMEEVLKRKVEVEFVMLGEAPENDPLVRKAIEIFGADLVQLKD